MNFPYPGDDPAALSSAALAIERAERQLESFNRTVLASQSGLGDLWEGDVAERVAADLHKLAVAVPQLQAKLTEARTALDDYRGAIMGIRSEVDALRKQHQNLSEALAGEEYEYRNAGTRFDGLGDGADLDSYRAGLAQSQEQTARRIESLTDMYDALVARAVQAAGLCAATIRLDSLAPGAPGQARAGLAQGYGLDRFSVAHLETMRGEADSFVQTAEQFRDGGAMPMEGADLVSTLTQRFGSRLGDADFVAAVIELGGAGDLDAVRGTTA
jgi:hypothetical protein